MTGHAGVVSLSSAQLVDISGPIGGSIDSSTLLGTLPSELLALADSLVVKIWDDKSSVIYRYNTFISKEYTVEDGHVKFGVRRLKLAGMVLVVGIRIDCDYLDPLIESLD
jgi:hypothetical protein